jgi:hypothetical protein
MSDTDSLLIEMDCAKCGRPSDRSLCDRCAEPEAPKASKWAPVVEVLRDLVVDAQGDLVATWHSTRAAKLPVGTHPVLEDDKLVKRSECLTAEGK